MNFILFLNITRVIFMKTFSPQSSRHCRYRKWFKSTLILLPLFGIHYSVTTVMAMASGRQSSVQVIWLFVDQIFSSFQGAVVAWLYCFCNTEVRSVLGSSWIRWKISKNLFKRAEIRSRNHQVGNQHTPTTGLSSVFHVGYRDPTFECLDTLSQVDNEIISQGTVNSFLEIEEGSEVWELERHTDIDTIRAVLDSNRSNFAPKEAVPEIQILDFEPQNQPSIFIVQKQFPIKEQTICGYPIKQLSAREVNYVVDNGLRSSHCGYVGDDLNLAQECANFKHRAECCQASGMFLQNSYDQNLCGRNCEEYRKEEGHHAEEICPCQQTLPLHGKCRVCDKNQNGSIGRGIDEGNFELLKPPLVGNSCCGYEKIPGQCKCCEQHVLVSSSRCDEGNCFVESQNAIINKIPHVHTNMEFSELDHHRPRSQSEGSKSVKFSPGEISTQERDKSRDFHKNIRQIDYGNNTLYFARHEKDIASDLRNKHKVSENTYVPPCEDVSGKHSNTCENLQAPGRHIHNSNMDQSHRLRSSSEGSSKRSINRSKSCRNSPEQMLQTIEDITSVDMKADQYNFPPPCMEIPQNGISLGKNDCDFPHQCTDGYAHLCMLCNCFHVKNDQTSLVYNQSSISPVSNLLQKTELQPILELQQTLFKTENLLLPHIEIGDTSKDMQSLEMRIKRSSSDTSYPETHSLVNDLAVFQMKTTTESEPLSNAKETIFDNNELMDDIPLFQTQADHCNNLLLSIQSHFLPAESSAVKEVVDIAIITEDARVELKLNDQDLNLTVRENVSLMEPEIQQETIFTDPLFNQQELTNPFLDNLTHDEKLEFRRNMT